MIKTAAGTVCYLRKTILLRNPHKDDVEKLISFALSKLDGRKASLFFDDFHVLENTPLPIRKFEHAVYDPWVCGRRGCFYVTLHHWPISMRELRA
jgi:hypothetical protein